MRVIEDYHFRHNSESLLANRYFMLICFFGRRLKSPCIYSSISKEGNLPYKSTTSAWGDSPQLTMLYQSKSQSDARTATANLKRCRALLCPHTSKVRSTPDGRGMASDPVNGPGSVRRKAAVLFFTNGTTCITTCSGIPNLWHAQNAPSELGEEVVLPTTSRTLIETTKSQVVTCSNKPIANFLNCKELFSIAFGSSP